MNLFNFMDGIDGLAGVEALFLCSWAAVVLWGILSQKYFDVRHRSARSFVVELVSRPFVFWGCWQCFLSFMIGSLAWITVIERKISLAAWLIVVALFVTDATITLLTRLYEGFSPLEGHATHAYQCLARRWSSHAKVCWVYSAINLFLLLPLSALALLYPAFAWVGVVLAYGSVAWLVWDWRKV